MTTLITGTTSGIGEATAYGFAKARHHLIMANRNMEKAEQVRTLILKQYPEAQIDLLHIDLADFDSVRKFVTEFTQKYKQLDILINNAGLVSTTKQFSPQNVELTMAANYFGPFLLTNLLLQKYKPERVINVASAAHKQARFIIDKLVNGESYAPWGSYADSKLGNILFSYELARRRPDISISCLHPGLINTGLWRVNTGLWGKLIGIFGKIVGPLMFGTDYGSKTSLYVATAPLTEIKTGQYFSNCKAVSSTNRSYDENLQRKLWELSERVTKLH